MQKVIGVLFLIAAAAQAQNATSVGKIYHNSDVDRTDDYINLNRQQYSQTLQDYDLRIDHFKQLYAGRLSDIETLRDLVNDGLVQTQERLNPLEVLSDFSKSCVTKYRSKIPTVAATTTSINSCVTVANNQLNSLLSSPLSTRNSLQTYYTNYFEKELTTCAKNHVNTTANYTTCVTTVTSTTNVYTINNQKTFAIQMDAADCSANANIKKAFDCTFTVQNRTISLQAEANTLINKCLLGQDDCNKCNQGFHCNSAYYLESKDIDPKNQTMKNPFYGNNYYNDCLMLVIDANP